MRQTVFINDPSEIDPLEILFQHSPLREACIEAGFVTDDIYDPLDLIVQNSPLRTVCQKLGFLPADTVLEPRVQRKTAPRGSVTKEIIRLYGEGMNGGQIAKELHLFRPYVYKVLKQWREQRPQ